jgi:DNA-binding beta-propeller fold protein YncE
MRRLAIVLATAAVAFGLTNCGTGFKLPAEVKRQSVVGNGTYERIATWTGFERVHDLLLTKTAVASNAQLYALFRTEPGFPGTVYAYPLSTPTPFSFRYLNMKNPAALCGDATRLFVLDQGDTCAARSNPATGLCDTTGNYLLPAGQKWTNKVAYLDRYWRVLEYFPDGGDTVSSFTDTTLAWVQGIAVDDQQRVYISGLFILVTQNPNNPFLYERRFSWRVHRYLRGGGDPNMPGSAWHRDPAYVVEEGSGLGTAEDPRGLDWSPADGGGLFIADAGNNRAQRRSDPVSPSDYLILDGELLALNTPRDISADLAGFSYVIDGGTVGVFRYRRVEDGGISNGTFVQRVDIEPSSAGLPLQEPVAVAADNDLVYVADAQAGEVAVFRRRK